MEEEIKPKKITRKEKVPLITTRDMISKNFPQAQVTLVNVFGEMVVDTIELTLKTPAHYNSMPFFYERLLPLLIPLENLTKEQEEELKKEKEKRIKNLVG